MSILRINKEQWPRWKKRILNFVGRYKDKHITKEASSKLRALKKVDLGDPGTLVLVAAQNKRLVGVLVGVEHGKGCSLAVVKRSTRGRGLGKELLRRAIAELGSFHAEIASDNVPSLKIAFACGLLGYDVFVRDTGKTVLILKTFKGCPNDTADCEKIWPPLAGKKQETKETL